MMTSYQREIINKVYRPAMITRSSVCSLHSSTEWSQLCGGPSWFLRSLAAIAYTDIECQGWRSTLAVNLNPGRLVHNNLQKVKPMLISLLGSDSSGRSISLNKFISRMPTINQICWGKSILNRFQSWLTESMKLFEILLFKLYFYMQNDWSVI